MKNMTMITAKEANDRFMDHIKTLTKEQYQNLVSDKLIRDKKEFEEEKVRALELEAKIEQVKLKKEQEKQDLIELILKEKEEDSHTAYEHLLEIEELICKAIPVGDRDVIYYFNIGEKVRWNRILQTIINELTAKGYIATVPLQEHNEYFEIVESNIHQLHVRW